MSVDEIDETRQAEIADAIQNATITGFQFLESLEIFKQVDLGQIINNPENKDLVDGFYQFLEYVDLVRVNATGLREILTDPKTYEDMELFVSDATSALMNSH